MGDLAPIYRHADVYDAFYEGRGRAYESDARTLARQIRHRNAAASSLLDVACGTGRSLRWFAECFEHVEGIDIAPDMLRVARDRAPGVPLHRCDMRSFDLGRRFDAVTCLFSAIGYVGDAGQLESALCAFGRHLRPGGVLAVEPWYFPETALSDRVTGDLVTVGGRTISRMSHTVREGRLHRMAVHYLVGEEGTGVRHLTDRHLLSLFTRREYETAFARAGAATVEYLKTGPGRPGMFIGVME
ncbi:class I SAM-dependent DNA methyltransferase [Actinomadura fibrosa]|uniref:Class I SAM-dependent DNA methyltransferase n=1 Tax=Actinomadura fibrosa TaxID=111802 RepID=A0ABW2Y0Y7_9ACTN|nr:class I SAM-dependent methyltransferase [Actinomadura fibrosa]